MDINDKKEDAPEKNEGFINFVLSGKKNHDDMLNMLQYMLYGIVPVILLIRLSNLIIPDYNPNNSNLENLAESLGQYGILLLGIWIIDRTIRYFPSWTKTEYHDFNYTFILAFLLAAHRKGSPYGIKLNKVADSVLSSIGLMSKKTEEPSKKEQPMHPAQLGPPPPVSSQHNTAQISTPPLLPDNADLTKIPSPPSPDFNAMYQHNNTPLPDAATPGLQVPMAANEGFMGGGSSW